ncbi:Endoplasmic reticulum resident protein [Schizosaccharomyces pombe]|uniref:Uncharacterized protein C12B10.02c n=1 Tax=Schizosaccharomyces pombe (strain 972 / ATCC 24843) TaxID=284812 RepID=YDE2_SCHPO|nr:uncharacterized protein SPAC12B10.02c [Schizosaccharomyces pombe]Q10436.1 RecName: Full=Uncharacterized protein C12B10.02c [Schizosaccharomyces pombe 972h-]CAA94692.1 endoplasmic reticulum resident protein required for packaging into COPII vesicles (predicted) [Schizosaccharomyces pombe]|eukprot:NP_594634.1 uncharacterized protein SPAC12B10.02c [Schizosaccharomyces pombe]
MSNVQRKRIDIRRPTLAELSSIRSIAMNALNGQSRNLSQKIFWHPLYLAVFGLVFMGIYRLTNMVEGNTKLRTFVLLILVSAVFLTLIEFPCRNVYAKISTEDNQPDGCLAEENLKHFYMARIDKERVIGIIGILPANAPGAYQNTPTIVHWTVIPKFYQYAFDLLDSALREAKEMGADVVSARVYSTDPMLKAFERKDFTPVVDEAFDYLSFFGLRRLVLQKNLSEQPGFENRR